MKIAAIVQARMGSSRLPGKVLMDLTGKPTLQRVVERLKCSKYLDDVIVATTINKTDDSIIEFCNEFNYSYFRGSEEDVLDRVLKTAKYHNVDLIIEITADCPLIDYNHVNALIELYKSGDYDFVSNVEPRTFPRGYDIRVFSTKALERADAEVDNAVDRQHVGTWFYLNPKGKENYKRANWKAPSNQHRPDIEVTLDTPEDLELIRWIFDFEKQGYNLELNCENVIGLLDTYPHVLKKVKEIQRKDYFEELNNWYKIANKFAKKLEDKILNGDGKENPAGILASYENDITALGVRKIPMPKGKVSMPKLMDETPEQKRGEINVKTKKRGRPRKEV